MAIEAPISKFKKTNLKIYIAICIALVFWCVYDAYFNEKFKEKYTDADGNPTGWLVVNRKAPPYLIGAAALFGAYLFVIKGKKILANENELIISDKKRISYDSIQQIDKTYFEKKGFFVITYKDKDGKEVKRKLNDRTYDNLAAILEHLVANIS
ncbi:hypothetical protein ES703_34752 [subsurface metagenome]